jgi:hypothetical protein
MARGAAAARGRLRASAAARAPTRRLRPLPVARPPACGRPPEIWKLDLRALQTAEAARPVKSADIMTAAPAGRNLPRLCPSEPLQWRRAGPAARSNLTMKMSGS